MIPYGRQDISEADIRAVVEVLRSDWLTQGPAVPEFESALATHCGSDYVIAVNSATSALHLGCRGLGLGPGDLLWTSPITFVASANCALYCGAQVDFVDIDPRTYNMSSEALSEKLASAKKSGRLPKIVMPVHFCGQSCDMAAVYALSREYGFRIIEDASHAIGGQYRQKNISNCEFSDIAVFSFHPVKIITTAEGGAAVTNNLELADQMRRDRSHGITRESDHMLRQPGDEIWNYQQIQLGFNYRMNDIQAALGISQFARLEEFIAKRTKIAERYDAAFAELPIITPWQHPDALSAYHLYPICIPQGVGATQRDVYDLCWENGIAVNLHYCPVYRHPFYQEMGFNVGYCPEAERYFKEAISLPIFPTLSCADQDTVIKTISEAVI
jgi:UDP-4-amino-4,6-dideoxy-N-acetyl-beta-L-altrosamine transaminase